MIMMMVSVASSRLHFAANSFPCRLSLLACVQRQLSVMFYYYANLHLHHATYNTLLLLCNAKHNKHSTCNTLLLTNYDKQIMYSTCGTVETNAAEFLQPTQLMSCAGVIR